MGRRIAWPPGPVENDLGSLQRYQTRVQHRVDLRQNCLDPLLRLDALDHEGQIEREEFHVGALDVPRCTEPHDAAKDSRAGILAVAQQLHDLLVQRLPLELVALTNVNAHQDPLSLQAVHLDHPRRWKLATDRASAKPAIVAISESATLRATYAPARPYSPPSIMAAVS
jgi:hypothetical protein